MRGSRATSLLTPRAVKILIGLPLILAGFALTLQWSGPSRHEGSPLLISGTQGFDLNGATARSDIVHHGRVLGDAHKQQQSSGSQSKPQQQQQQQQQQQKPADLWRPGASWKPDANIDAAGPKLAFVATTADSFRQIKLWVNYHQVLGVSLFYLFVDGQAARQEVQQQLNSLPGVRAIPRDDALKKQHAESRIWNETWLAAFFHKPCNHELFVRQSLNMEAGIQLAKKDNVQWILHIDTDELMYPGGSPEFSLQRLLGSMDADVDTLVFPNYESLPERDDVHDPFTEVTLFKRNYHHVVSEQYFKNYHTVSRGNPNYFITYGNGKSAARVQPGLRPNGAHRWYSYVKAPKEITSDQAAVLHFTYNRFQDLKSRRDRCDCAPTEDDAKRCFILPFDRMAFLEASMKSEDELMGWFRDRLVWSDTGVVTDLLKSGLFVRMYTPQVVMRGFMAADEAESAAAAQAGQLHPPPGQAGAGLS